MTSPRPAIPTGLYPIIDVSHFSDWSLYSACEHVLAGGARWLQLRAKPLPESEFLREAAKVAYLKIHNRFLLIINHSVDIAAKIGADGVHLTAQSLSIAAARTRLSAQALIGYSAHSLTEALAAEAAGADYISLGAIFPTPYKAQRHPIHGIAGLRQVVEALRIPVIAVGGIGETEVYQLRDLKRLHGFSVIRAILANEAPTRATGDLIEMWKTAIG